MTLSTEEVARRFVGSYTLSDVDPKVADLFAPTISVRHNYDAERMEMPGSLYAKAMMWKIHGCSERVTDYRDKIDHFLISDNAFTIAATGSGTMPDGSPLYISRCLIVKLENGKIAWVDSYSDHTHSAPLDNLLPYTEMFAAIGQS